MIQNLNFGVAPGIFDEASAARLGVIVPIGAILKVQCKGLEVSQSCFSQLHFKKKPSQLRQNVFKKVAVVNSVVIKGSKNKFENCRFAKVTDEGVNTVMSGCVTVPEWLAILQKV